jgi:large subunit ribosomal protein L6
VKLAVANGNVSIEGPNGKLKFSMNSRISADFKNNVLTLKRMTDEKTDKALHGTTRSIINNMIKGVTEGYVKELLIEGVGFKAAVQGKVLTMALGFTHPVIFNIPEGRTPESSRASHASVSVICPLSAEKSYAIRASYQILRDYESQVLENKLDRRAPIVEVRAHRRDVRE